MPQDHSSLKQILGSMNPAIVHDFDYESLPCRIMSVQLLLICR